MVAWLSWKLESFVTKRIAPLFLSFSLFFRPPFSVGSRLSDRLFLGVTEEYRRAWGLCLSGSWKRKRVVPPAVALIERICGRLAAIMPFCFHLGLCRVFFSFFSPRSSRFMPRARLSAEHFSRSGFHYFCFCWLTLRCRSLTSSWACAHEMCRSGQERTRPF